VRDLERDPLLRYQSLLPAADAGDETSACRCCSDGPGAMPGHVFCSRGSAARGEHHVTFFIYFLRNTARAHICARN